MTCGVLRVLHAALREDASLYHFHDPELIPVGLLLSALGKRVIYDVHECVPEQVFAKAYIPRPLRPLVSRAVGAAEAVMALFFDGIVAATPHIARRFPRRKTALVQNFPTLSAAVAGKQPSYQQRAPTAVYVGGIDRPRGICELVSAMSLVPENLRARLSLVGGIRPITLETQLRGMAGWRYVDFWGRRDYEEVFSILSQARLGVVTLLPKPAYLRSQPTKLFEYMAAGLPVVASDFPYWREIVEGVGCGLLVDPRCPQAIARAVEWLLIHPREAEQMGQRGRAAVADRYNWQKELPKLLKLYDRLLHGPHQRGRGTTSIHQSGDPQRSAPRAA
jgi:hypothetical protein